MKQEKTLSIELLKFFALLIILNGHSDRMYESYSFLATGGAIGDALFFFCSGFTIFLGRMDRFDNWYKRRICRIFPSIISWSLILAFFFENDRGILWSIMYTGGWFVSCILIYYVILYFVRKFLEDNLWIPLVLTIGATLIWYYFEDSSHLFMYGQTYFRWCHFFLFMLLGSMVGKKYIKTDDNMKRNAVLLLLCFIGYYGILALSSKFIGSLQILSLIPLIGIVYFGYCLCCSGLSNRVLANKYIGTLIRAIAALCLESYIVQDSFLTTKYNFLFPLNLILIWSVILVVAYLTRCLGRIIKQLFERENFRWDEVFVLY